MRSGVLTRSLAVVFSAVEDSPYDQVGGYYVEFNDEIYDK